MNKNSIFGFDLGILIPVVILVVIGLATLLSVNVGYFKSQLIFFILSLFLFFVFSQVSLKVLELYSPFIYIASLALLFIVLLLGIESRGAIRWIELGVVRIQFSEILKPLLIIPFASLLSKKGRDFQTFVMALVYLLPVVLFIFLQPDLGSAIIYILVAIISLVALGFPLLWFGTGILALALLFPAFWHFLHEYQKQRIMTFIHPTKDPLGTSYNAIQALIAVGSGMLFGKGLGEGTQSGLRFLPERHTDFIYATLSEDFGFIGGVIVILVFAYLLYRIYILFQSTNDSYYKIFIICGFLLLLIQFCINLGMNLGLLPVVGVPLPFISYGGSSLLSNFILIGMLSSISRTIHSRNTLEIR